jgi:hypothetical protein
VCGLSIAAGRSHRQRVHAGRGSVDRRARRAPILIHARGDPGTARPVGAGEARGDRLAHREGRARGGGRDRRGRRADRPRDRHGREIDRGGVGSPGRPEARASTPASCSCGDDRLAPAATDVSPATATAPRTVGQVPIPAGCAEAGRTSATGAIRHRRRLARGGSAGAAARADFAEATSTSRILIAAAVGGVPAGAGAAGRRAARTPAGTTSSRRDEVTLAPASASTAGHDQPRITRPRRQAIRRRQRRPDIGGAASAAPCHRTRTARRRPARPRCRPRRRLDRRSLRHGPRFPARRWIPPRRTTCWTAPPTPTRSPAPHRRPHPHWTASPRCPPPRRSRRRRPPEAS